MAETSIPLTVEIAIAFGAGSTHTGFMIRWRHAIWIGLQLLSVTGLSGADPGKQLGKEDEQAFVWFSSLSSLGVISSKGLQPVEVWTGGTMQGGDGTLKIKAITYPGFLLARDGKRFSTVSLWLMREDYEEKGSVPEPGRIAFETRTPEQVIPSTSWFSRKWEDTYHAEFEPLPDLQEFLIAWHWWNHNRPDLAAGFLNHLRERAGNERQTPPDHDPSIRQLITPEAASYLLKLIIKSFDDPRLTRTDLAKQLGEFIKQFPGEKATVHAECLAKNLESLIRDGLEHPLLSDEELGKLPPAERAVELIRRLRDWGLRQNDLGTLNPYRELRELGDSAVPALIAAVDDHRPCREVVFNCFSSEGRLEGGRLESIGDAAFQLIRDISGRQFNHWAQSNADTPQTEGPSAARIEIEKWWAEYQSMGKRQYLIAAVAKGDANLISMARRLIAEFPADTGPAIVQGYHALKTSAERQNVLGFFPQFNDPECIALLRHEFEQTDNLEIKTTSAASLRSLGQTDTLAEMLKQWSLIKSSRAARGSGDLIRFLANSQDAEAIRQLTENLGSLPEGFRRAIMEDLAGSYEKSIWNRNIATSPEIQWLIEEKLVSLLSDDQDLWHTSGIGFHNPTVGDLAAWRLARILPDRYQFDISGSYEERETGRLKCYNIWRSLHGLPASPPFCALDQTLENPNQIAEVRFADDGLKGSSTETALKAMQGNPINARDLIDIVCGFGGDLPDGLSGIKIRAVRISKPVGVRITVWTIQGKPAETWRSFFYSGEVTPHGKEACELCGTRDHQDIGKTEEWAKWQTAMDDAIKLPGDTELLLRIGVWVTEQ